MKTVHFIAAAIAATSLQGQDRFQQEALLLDGESQISRVWIGDSNETSFLYFEFERGVDSKTMRITGPDGIWLTEPESFTEALELFQGRDYEEARAAFAAVRREYIKLRHLPDNHSSLAAYYEMESLRRLGKLDELVEAQEVFTPADRETLTREHHKRQLEMYAMWDAIRQKAWSRVEVIGKAWLEQQLPGYQRAQAGYGLGLALEGQDRPLEAIDAYNIAMVADTGSSQRIAAESAINSLRLYLEDEDLKLARKLHGTPDEEPNSTGARLLEEAASLASLYQLTLGGGEPLPADYQQLLAYAPTDPSPTGVVPSAAPEEPTAADDGE